MPEPTEYRRKPNTITAMQWDGTAESAAAIIAWAALDGVVATYTPPLPYMTGPGAGLALEASLEIETARGTADAEPGDYIIRGAGEFYPCPAAVFVDTHTDADDDGSAALEQLADRDALLVAVDRIVDEFGNGAEHAEFVGQIVDAVLAARPTPGADSPAAELATMTEDRDRLWRVLSEIADTARDVTR